MHSTELQSTLLQVENWGLLDYQVAFERQAELVAAHISGFGVDTLVLVEHPATVTLGRRASEADLRYAEMDVAAQGVRLQSINRGGLATAHEPGQLVAYPILTLKKHDLRWYSQTFLEVVIQLLTEYGLTGVLRAGEPGVWVEGRKICSFGIAVKKWISSHGIALNVNNDLSTFDMIIPCGRPDEKLTSISRELGKLVDMSELQSRFVSCFCDFFDYSPKSLINR